MSRLLLDKKEEERAMRLLKRYQETNEEIYSGRRKEEECFGFCMANIVYPNNEYVLYATTVVYSLLNDAPKEFSTEELFIMFKLFLKKYFFEYLCYERRWDFVSEEKYQDIVNYYLRQYTWFNWRTLGSVINCQHYLIKLIYFKDNEIVEDLEKLFALFLEGIKN